MRKSLFYVALLFVMFFCSQYVVKASDSFAYVTMTNSSGTNVGSLDPNKVQFNVNSQTDNFNIGLLDTNYSSGSPFYVGEKFRITARWCSSSIGGNWALSRNLSPVNIQINDINITKKSGTCSFTDSGGNVFVGNGTVITTVEFTLTKVSLNPHIVLSLQYSWGDFSSLSSYTFAFLGYDILQGDEVSQYNNTQDIIDSNYADTQSIINNQNANTDRIVNAQNGTTNAVNNNTSAINNNTNAVNNMNGNITSTNTSGSESFLTDIINDPAFQDNTGINGIIQLPLAMVSSLSNSCESVNLHIPFLNVDTQLPCIRQTIYNKMPGVANLIFIAVNGFVLYRILIDIVGLIKSARNPDEDRLDVLEL